MYGLANAVAWCDHIKTLTRRPLSLSALLLAALVGAGMSAALGQPGTRPGELALSYELALTFVAIVCFGANFAASIRYLACRRPGADALAVAAARVGLVFCSAALITGPIWSDRASSLWWTRGMVLTGSLLVWPIYLSYLLLRRYSNPGQTAVLTAVLGIFGFLDLPLAYFAVAVRSSRASPAEISELGAMHERSYRSVASIVITLIVLAAGAVWQLYRLERDQQAIDEQAAFTIEH